MKNFLVVLSAALVAGLVIYALFCGSFGVLGNTVTMPLDTLVWLFATLSVSAAALSLALRTLLVHSERSVLARITELEKARSS